MKKLTVCLQTCGEETERECLSALGPTSSFVFQEVRNVTPAVNSLNKMMTQCETSYLIPLDADMVLRTDWLERVMGKLATAQGDWHSILFPLWDTITYEKILALKVLNMEKMGHILFKDDPCPDIRHYREMTDCGLRCLNFFDEDPIGDHVVRGNFFCYAKYRDLYMVHRAHPQSVLSTHFKGGNNICERALNHYNFFKDQWIRTGNNDYCYCIAGMVEGLTAPLRYVSKDLSDREMRVKLNMSDKSFWEWYNTNVKARIFL